MAMKKINSIALMLMVVGYVSAQNHVHVYQTNDAVQTIAVEQIDSAGFHDAGKGLKITGPKDFVREDQVLELTTNWDVNGKRANVQWSAEDATLVSCSGDKFAVGYITGVKEGNTVIMASCDGQVATYPLTIIRRTTADISILPQEGASLLYEKNSLQFSATLNQPALCSWDFGDGTPLQEGNALRHTYDSIGQYTVRVYVDDYMYSTRIDVVKVLPIVSLVPESKPIQLGVTKVTASATLYNPENKDEKVTWIFPEGTTDASGKALTTFVGKTPGVIKFNTEGTNVIKIATNLGGVELDTVLAYAQVAGNGGVAPTLYLAAAQGNFMAYKLTAEGPSSIYNLGVPSGDHPFSLHYDEAQSKLIVLDAGKMFYYQNEDAQKTGGDGVIKVYASDCSESEVIISNVGGPAFQDPFYGYIEGDDLYYADRNTGIIKVKTTDRNMVYSADAHPYHVQHALLGYYNNGWGYGAIGGTIEKVNDIWHWAKFYNANGIFRFKDSDILPAAITGGDDSNKPKDGIWLSGMTPKSFVHHNGKYYFTLLDAAYEGFYVCTEADFNTIGTSKSKLAPFKKKYGDLEFIPNKLGTIPSLEGSGSESIGICQMAVDKATGCVYFGYRNTYKTEPADPENPDKDKDEIATGAKCAPTGLYCYNPKTDKITLVPGSEGLYIYGVTINNVPTVLF